MNTKGYSRRIGYKKKHILLSKKVIFDAVRGEEKALQAIIQHYGRYIDRLASRELYDCYGNLYVYHDPVLKTELQNKLIAGILKFHIDK